MMAACTTDESVALEPSIEKRECTSYSIDVCFIDADEQYAPEVMYVGDMGDKYCAIVREHSLSNDTDDYDCIYYIATNAEGDMQAYGGIRMDVQIGSSYASIGDKLLCLSSGKLFCLNLLDGSLISEQASFGATSVGLTACGYALMYSDRIELYNDSGEWTDTVVSNQNLYYPTTYSPMFEQDGQLYVVTINAQGYAFCLVDTDGGLIKEEISLSEYGLGNADCYGAYVFDDRGEYRISVNDRNLLLIADWDESSYKPASLMNSYSSYCPIDDKCFAKIYTCVGNSAEIQFFRYDENPAIDDRIEITVGGYGTEYADSLKMAAYLYNQAQNEYKVIIDSYEYTASNMYDEAASAAEMIRLLSSGDGPDILYGNTFDYNYMGRNGMVLNLSEYAGDYGIYQGVMDAYGDSIYCVFPGFYLSGYVGSMDDPDISEDMTYQQMYSLGDDTVGVCSPEFSVDIANYIISYPIDDLVSNTDGSELLSRDVLEDIITTCVSAGLPLASDDHEWGTPDDLALGRYRLYKGGIFLPYSYRDMCESCGTDLIYVGYPSVYGACHPIIPSEQLAVSSGTDYPEACAVFLGYLYSDEVQTFMVERGLIPSSAEYIRKIYDYSINPGSVSPDDPIARVVSEWRAIPQETADNYMRALDQSDCVCMIDWNLVTLIHEEIESYEISTKSPSQIAESMGSRLDLYVAEYYG